ncbi:MAG: M6 family metalloprotease domain-containing protein [Bacillota bacterium]|nr:M6 family metalloprotease domain-containing protein [Bacillota bacterium]
MKGLLFKKEQKERGLFTGDFNCSRQDEISGNYSSKVIKEGFCILNLKSYTFVSLIVLTLFVIISKASAAPYNGEVFKMKQPDNTYVDVKIWGDEYFQRAESIDGYTVCRDPHTGWICYANINNSSDEYVSSGVVYNKRLSANTITLKNGRKLTRGLKLGKSAILKKAREKHDELFLAGETGNTTSIQNSYNKTLDSDYSGSTSPITGLTILIDFSDCPQSISKEEISNLINQEGYKGFDNNGSVRDYFYDISEGRLIYTNQVIGYYRAKNPKSYYNDLNATGRAKELIMEALEALDKEGFDFSKLSLDENGMVMAVNFLYAGNPDVDWGKGLWPQSGEISKFDADGVYVSRYQMSQIGTKPQIGPFVHENCHMVCGYPDLYDYQYDSKGVGKYCVMGYTDPNNPQPPNGFLRSIMSGWGKVTKLNDLPDKTKVTIKADSSDVFAYYSPNANEFFIIENIQKKGRWACVPDEGLAIWHVDVNGNNDYQDMSREKHYEVSLVQADGLYELEKNVNYGGTDDLFHYGNKDSFDSNTEPKSLWWDETPSGLIISDISVEGDKMTFVIHNNNQPVSSGEYTITPTATPTATQTPTTTPTPTVTTSVTPTAEKITDTVTPTPTQVITSTPTSEPLNEPTYTISGYVAPDFYVDGNNPKTRQGFIVTLEGTEYSAITDNDGYFKINNIKPSNEGYQLCISKVNCYKKVIDDIVVDSDKIISERAAPIQMWCGDLNNDERINMIDVVILAHKFNSRIDGNYSEEVDLDMDGEVNFRDFLIVVKHFNTTQSDFS